MQALPAWQHESTTGRGWQWLGEWLAVREMETQMQEGLPLLVLAQVTHWKQPRPLSVAGLMLPTSSHELRAWLAPCCSSTAPLWDKSAGAGRRETTLTGNRPSLPDPQSYCSITLGSAPAPDRKVMATEQKGGPISQLALALVPPSPAPPYTKVKAKSTPWGKTWLLFTSNPNLPLKALGTHRLYRDTPT